MGYKEEALEFLGITRWHELGYRGQGIKFMSDEKVTEKRHPDVIVPNGYATKNNHGDDVMSHIKLVAPDGEFISYPVAGSFTGNSYKCPTYEYIKENKVHIWTSSSLGQFPPKGKQKGIQDCISAGCIFFTCAGNSGNDGVWDEAQYEGYYAVGGVRPKYIGDDEYDWNDLQKTRTSSVGQELDFVTIAEIKGISGTSFCSPIFAGMVGLVQQFFIEETGRRLTRGEMELFIKDNCIDVEVEGFDLRTGYGVFILPEPSTIYIKKYVSEYKETPLAELQIGNNTYLINGKPKTYDAAPFIQNGRTYTPVRFLEDIGFEVEWIENEQKVIIRK